VTLLHTGHRAVDLPEISDDALVEISRILEMRRNFSITIYKDACMKRRIAVRLRSCRCQDAAAYSELLRHNDSEVELLIKTLTIHVSHFFRNPSLFDKLQREIFPSLFLLPSQEGKLLRIWSCGCAGGEEAYSLAIILAQSYARELRRCPVEIHASDIDAEVLQEAARAEYDEDRLKEVPATVRERYFISNGSRMKLVTPIRKMVTFHQQNITDVDSFEEFQMVMCRNTLIYFTRPDQIKILQGIANILPAGGILVLGKSETLVGDVRGLFSVVCPLERIYRRR
jgi:chemotaxis protein methyltransferase CheR